MEIKQQIETPLGTMVAHASAKGLHLLKFADRLEKPFTGFSPSVADKTQFDANNHLNLLKLELAEYFNGILRDFSVPLVFDGTPFQMQVWEEIRQIDYGSTITYKEQSAKMNKPAAIRAVAQANGRNPIYIVVPCHRIIGSDGTLTGYGGGIWRKKYLFELEKKYK